MAFLDDKRFFVFGLGASGRAAVDLLASDGRDVVAYDDAPSAADAVVGPNVTVVEAGDRECAREALSSCDRVVLSPGVPLDHPLVEAARELGIPVDGEIEAAWHYTEARITAVTGTNGKSTTVSIVGNIFETAGISSVVAGNVGTPFASVVGGGSRYDQIVLELSSFQLDTVRKFRADVAVLLNVTPDHLDRYHHSFEEYAASKARILNRVGGDAWFVYNDSDTVCRTIAEGFDGKKASFSSIGGPGGDNACFLEDASIRRVWRGRVDTVIEQGRFAPVGVHNLENAMAAVLAASAAGVSLSDIRAGLRSYRPLPHRMERVRVVGGVTYINDSKATNVDATVKSLMGLEGGAVLILGGRDKDGDFHALTPHLGRVRKVIVIGEARDAIHSALDGKVDIADAPDMEAAVAAASRVAKTGDTVLLAPACASFDMFDDYKHRGEVFRSCVEALAGEAA